MKLDPELNAMSQVLEVFNELEQDQRKRIVDWLTARFQLVFDEDKQKDEIKLQESSPTTVQQFDTTPIVKEGAPEIDRMTPIDKQDLKQYESITDLLEESTATKVIDRILLAAAYLQEKKNLTELTSFEINSQLKKAGHGIPNISIGINRLLEKVPQLMAVTKREGNTKQSRRKFAVTEDGLQKVKSFLK